MHHKFVTMSDLTWSSLKASGVRLMKTKGRRRAIVAGVVGMCRQLGVTLIGEGVETGGEADALRLLGVRYQQGFLFARPAFESLPPITCPMGQAATKAA